MFSSNAEIRHCYIYHQELQELVKIVQMHFFILYIKGKHLVGECWKSCPPTRTTVNVFLNMNPMCYVFNTESYLIKQGF